MKKITLTLAFLAIICLSFTAQAGLIGKKAPVITTDLAVTDSLPALANKTITFTADFTNSGTTLNGTETLFAYFWGPWAFYWGGSASMVHVAGTLKWTVSFIPAVAFNHTQTEFLSNANNVCWYNIQTSTAGDDSGTLSLTFPKSKINPFLTTSTFSDKGPKVTCTQNGSTGSYILNQPVTWTLDLTGSIFGKDSLYLWAWDPTNPETLSGRTGTWNVPSTDNVSKLTRLGAQTWSLTLTPTTFYGKTVSELQTSNPSGFWMKIRSSNGLIQTQSFFVPTNVTVTNNINSPLSTYFTAYPNPVVDNLTITLNDNSFNQVSVYDFKGSMMSRVPISADQQQLNVGFSTFAKGVYLVVLNGNGKSESFKVVK
ncbi:MAG: T9SS type A sorting domain-containing protein [Paludibacter sp.]|jgi:Secretion system C-terminal sorting domain